MTWDPAAPQALARTAVGTVPAAQMRAAERAGLATPFGWGPTPPGGALVSC